MKSNEHNQSQETILPIWDELVALYDKNPTHNLHEDISHYGEHGYVFFGPDHVLMGKRVGDGWFIHCAVGKGAMRKFWDLMPYYLPNIGWARLSRGRNEVVWHSTDEIARRLGIKTKEPICTSKLITES